LFRASRIITMEQLVAQSSWIEHTDNMQHIRRRTRKM
jgi:hypothetical protein